MITRGDLNEKTQEEIQKLLNEGMEAYKVELEQYGTIEELEGAEKVLMEAMDVYQVELKQTEYSLANEVLFDEKEYKKSKVQDMIIYFLNKQEVEWQYTLGLYQAVKFWKNVGDTVPYEVYDSTLRLLNQVRFKGMTEWNDILVINEFMSKCHAEYTKDAQYLIYLSQLHNCLLDRAKMISPVETPEAYEVQEQA